MLKYVNVKNAMWRRSRNPSVKLQGEPSLSGLGPAGLTMIWICLQPHPALQPISTNSHPPSGLTKIKVNPTQVRDLMAQPVQNLTLG